jgi:hypothetical protein
MLNSSVCFHLLWKIIFTGVILQDGWKQGELKPRALHCTVFQVPLTVHTWELGTGAVWLGDEEERDPISPKPKPC